VREPGQRAGLRREAVVAAARTVLDEGAPLSMRGVAARLGVAPNALYSHVEGREGLLDAVLDDLLGTLPLPDPDADPEAGLTAVMTASHELLVAHPVLVPHFTARQGARGVNARRLGEAMRVLLARAGVTDRSAQDTAIRILVVHAIGDAAVAGGPDGSGPIDLDEMRASYATGLRWLLAGAFGS
jgi:TetR/AcrR family transcriptional regulator, tetracycline repressor protein